MGVDVVDERPYEIDRIGAPPAWIYDFGLTVSRRGRPPSCRCCARCPSGSPRRWRRSGAARPRTTGWARSCCWPGCTGGRSPSSAPTCSGCARPGCPSARSTSSRPWPPIPASSPGWSRCSRPASPPTGAAGRDRAAGRRWSSSLRRAIGEVESLDADRVLTALLAAVLATQRTTYYAGRPARRSSSTRPQVPDVPEPRPAREIWVSSPRVMGVHLRFGAVARGGLRWSDRPEDLRTEILGLVKAQTVKNTVIVPTGAKGGFVVKNPPPEGAARDEALAEGQACYRIFIGALLVAHRQPGRGPGRPAGAGGPARRRRLLPGRGRRQGDGDLLRPGQLGRARARASGSATPSPAAARSATTTRPWASPPAAPGSRSPATSASSDLDVQTRGLHRRRGRGHVRRRVRQRDAAVGAHPAGRRLRPPARLPRPDAGRRDVLRRAPAAVRPAALLVGRLRPVADQRGRRRLAADGEVDPGLARRCGRRSACPTASSSLTAGRADPRGAAGAGRPAVQRRHRHLRQGRRPRATSRSGTRPTTPCGWTAASCACGWSARAATSGSPSAGGSSTRWPAGKVNTDAIDNSAGVDTSDHEVNIKIALNAGGRRGPAGRRAPGARCCSEMADEVARRRPHRQPRAERDAGHRGGLGAQPARRPRAVHPGAGALAAGWTAQRRGPARRPRAGRAAARRARADRPGAVGAAGLRQARRPTPPCCDSDLPDDPALRASCWSTTSRGRCASGSPRR